MAETTHMSLLEFARSSSQDEAWRNLTDIYNPFIEGYLRRRGVREADIDDLKQEVLAVMLRELPNFQHNRRRGAFRSWLRSVLANRLRTYWRTPANRQRVGGTNYERLAEDLDDGRTDLSQVWDREHNKHVVESLLSVARERFGEKAIEAFRRTYLKGESFDEVAKSLDMTVNAVVLARSRVLRALRELGQGMID